MSEVSTKEAVKLAFEGNGAAFKEAVSDILLDKVYDAVELKKFEVAEHLLDDETVVAEENELEEGSYGKKKMENKDEMDDDESEEDDDEDEDEDESDDEEEVNASYKKKK